MSSYKEGQIHQLADVLEGAGFTGGDLTKLGQSKATLTLLLGAVRGTHEIKPIGHVIDLSSPARLPFDGATLEVHRGEGVVKLERRGDDLYLDGKEINLFLSKKQKSGSVSGNDLGREIEKRGGNVSAKVLDHLVEHPELWPESWKQDKDGNTLHVCFWGDIFRDSLDNFCVWYGWWDEGEVGSNYGWLGHDWSNDSPCAYIAK